MKSLTFAQLEAKLSAPAEPAATLPCYAPEPERLYRCRLDLHNRWESFKEACTRRRKKSEPESQCYCTEAAL